MKMDYSITKKRDYAWMSQASYLDFPGLSADDNGGLKLKLKNKAINEGKILADEQINTFVASNTGYQFLSPRRAHSLAVRRIQLLCLTSLFGGLLRESALQNLINIK